MLTPERRDTKGKPRAVLLQVNRRFQSDLDGGKQVWLKFAESLGELAAIQRRDLMAHGHGILDQPGCPLGKRDDGGSSCGLTW